MYEEQLVSLFWNTSMYLYVSIFVFVFLFLFVFLFVFVYEFPSVDVWRAVCVSVWEQIFVSPPNHHLSFSTTDLMSQLMSRQRSKIATIFCRQQGQIFLQLSTVFLQLSIVFCQQPAKYFLDCQPGVYHLSQLKLAGTGKKECLVHMNFKSFGINQQAKCW